MGREAVAGAALVGAMVGGIVGYVVAPEPPRTQECLYAAVSAYPALPADKLALDVTPACKGITETEKAQLRGMVSRFVDSAVSKAAKEG